MNFSSLFPLKSSWMFKIFKGTLKEFLLTDDSKTMLMYSDTNGLSHDISKPDA